jgi:uncharacterized protein YecE (DUF72 family)
VIAVKASRYLTHLKRLRDPQEPIARLFERAAALGTWLGPILYQLPPGLSLDLGRLAAFFATLPHRWPVWSPRPPRMKRLTHVIEFRHPSWYVADTFQALADAGVALCLHDKRGSEIAEPAVGPAVYVRFLGTSGQYHGSYSDKVLGRWARRPSRAPAGRYAGVCVLQQRPGRGGGQKRADPTSLMAGSASTRHVPVDA